MYDIRQFKPALYILLMLGFSGFALAAQTPEVWFLSAAATALNATLIKTRRFTPIPHWLANAVTLIAMVLFAIPLRDDQTKAVLFIGEFLVALQVVKLYEQRGNRDFGQLLVLSLLLMVAASINTASLVFGVLLIAYLFLSLYCCLLFHLKVETDQAKVAIGMPEDVVNPATLRQDQQFLSRSMRRLTVAVSAVAIFMAVMVFLFFPRGAGAGLLGPLQFKPSPMTGFNDVVSFQHIAQISQSDAEVAWVKVWKDGVLVRGTEPLLLRGLTLDVYSGNDDSQGAARTWARRLDPQARDAEVDHDVRIAPPSPRWKQQITLQPTGTQALFAMPGLFRLDAKATDTSLRYSPSDEVLQTVDSYTQPIIYTVESTGRVVGTPREFERPSGDPSDGEASAMSINRVSSYDKAIEDFARRPEVSGVDAIGPLAERRKKDVAVDPLDPIIAQNISNYLQRNFTYTLDLTDAGKIYNRDPLVAFLYDFKRGHCEYFAGAMTLMCQSLGMNARMVVGFKCDEFNTLMHQYHVTQNQAHAWVEVLDPSGEWRTYDPTSGRGADKVISSAGLWRRTIQVFQFLEYKWADSVVAYDSHSRANLISNVDRSLTSAAVNSSTTPGKVGQWLVAHEDAFASRATSVLLAGMIMVLIVSAFLFLFERWRLSQRARRIGLNDLPVSDQMRLVRQLGFYDEMVRLLERHHITRPSNQTPMEFSESIEFLPHEVFDSINRLTAIFYRVRYGRHELTPGQQKHLAAVIAKLNAAMQSA
jgi:protein-glutamine gamma-glutamyltransferase